MGILYHSSPCAFYLFIDISHLTYSQGSRGRFAAPARGVQKTASNSSQASPQIPAPWSLECLAFMSSLLCFFVFHCHSVDPECPHMVKLGLQPLVLTGLVGSLRDGAKQEEVRRCEGPLGTSPLPFFFSQPWGVSHVHTVIHVHTPKQWSRLVMD